MQETLNSKKKGDAAFRQKDFRAAIENYTQVIFFSPPPPPPPFLSEFWLKGRNERFKRLPFHEAWSPPNCAIPWGYTGDLVMGESSRILFLFGRRFSGTSAPK